MEKEEIWKPVLGYEGNYEASNLGKIRNAKNKKILSISISTKKQKDRFYRRQYISLSKHNKVKKYLLHKVVYEAFNGKIPKDLQIDHIDNNPENNNLSNLQLLTLSENLKKRAIDNPMASFGSPKKSVLCIETNKKYGSLHEVEQLTGISRKDIRFCCRGEKHKTAGGYHWTFIE